MKDKIYPFYLSLGMIIGAVVLSFVDLSFLSAVLGRVLDLDTFMSMVVSFGVGIVGIVLMASQGARLARGDRSLGLTIILYTIWLLLGVGLAMTRLMSAYILGFSVENGDEGLVDVLGITMSSADFVIAPIMFVLYLATGLLAKEGVENLLPSPEWKKIADKRERENARKEKARVKALAKQEKVAAEAEEARIKAMQLAQERALQNEKNGSYGHALKNFRNKEAELKRKYERIVENIEFIKQIDKQEDDFESKIKPGFISIVEASIKSVQNEVLLMVHRKDRGGIDGSIAKLRDILEDYNQGHREAR